MNYNKIRIATAVVFILAGSSILPSCKTTEENYRAAYEKTMAARQKEDDIEATIYGKERRRQLVTTIETDKGEVEVRSQLVRITENGGGVYENVHRYNVVVGQFKQIFNAKSLRQRLVDAGYTNAFIVETAEPFYYIVLESFSDAGEAATSMEHFKASGAISMREPCPFILGATVQRPAGKSK